MNAQAVLRIVGPLALGPALAFSLAAGQLLPVPLAYVLGAIALAGSVAHRVWRAYPVLVTPVPAKSLSAAVIAPAISPAVDPPPDIPLGSIARSILDELPDAILVVDQEDRLIIANRTARTNFVGAGYERKFLSTVMRRPAVLEALQRVRQSGLAETAEFTDLVPVERFFQVQVSPVMVNAGGGLTLLAVLKDLTSTKALEQMRADFVANASHELRTPLSSLSGFIETLRGHARDDPAARERFLAIMQDQASRMRRLIDDLLSLSRIELNEHVPPSRSVDLRLVAHDVIDAMQPLAREARMSLRLSSAPEPCAVLGERDELVQVLQNLIDNAVKYGRPETEIEVAVGKGAPLGAPEMLEASYFVSVCDQGEGIAREHIPRLTERFYRVDVKQSRERGGTGLGLAIVKHIVSRHRGRLHIKSDLGKGSTFSMILPAVPERAQPAPDLVTAKTHSPQGIVAK